MNIYQVNILTTKGLSFLMEKYIPNKQHKNILFFFFFFLKWINTYQIIVFTT